jgi:xanthine dehydrogenase accessory factor
VEIATEIFTARQLAQVEDWAAREQQGRFSLSRTIAGRLVELEYGEDPRTVIVFGAGHVGRALVMALAPLPFRVVWVDPRPGAFPAAIPRNAQALNGEDPLSALPNVPDGTLAFIMSHSHALDLVVTDAALRHPAIAEVGLIGSATKRARFEHRLRAAGVPDERVSGLICPIGVVGIPSKLPAAIAAATAAQILVIDARLRLVMEAAKPQETQMSARGALR